MRQYPLVSETILCKIKPSTVSGVGLFAVKDIEQGTKMFISEQLPQEFLTEGFDTLEEGQQEIILERFPIHEETGFIHPHSDYLLSFVNHNEEANYSPLYDVATRDIKKGEEIFFDYGNHNPTR